MADCPTTFTTHHPLPPSPAFLSGSVFAAGPPHQIDIVFTPGTVAGMNQAVTPPDSVWMATVDGNPTSVGTPIWQSATTLRLTVASAGPSVSGILSLVETHIDLRNTGGSFMRATKHVIYFP